MLLLQRVELYSICKRYQNDQMNICVERSQTRKFGKGDDWKGMQEFPGLVIWA